MTVVKIGGGLAGVHGDAALRRLCGTVAEVAARHPLLIVPGGGQFADLVRDHDSRFSLRPSISHHMALLAMDQFGLVLSELIPGAERCDDPADAVVRAAQGRATVLAPIAAAVRASALPHSWEVSSDSIAVWCASAAGAARAVMVKPVDGLCREWPGDRAPCLELTADELDLLLREGRCAGVDRYLPTVIREARLEVWVIGGAHPERLVELLDRGSTEGTQLTP